MYKMYLNQIHNMSMYLQICFTLLVTMAIDRKANPNDFLPTVSMISTKTRTKTSEKPIFGHILSYAFT